MLDPSICPVLHPSIADPKQHRCKHTGNNDRLIHDRPNRCLIIVNVTLYYRPVPVRFLPFLPVWFFSQKCSQFCCLFLFLSLARFFRSIYICISRTICIAAFFRAEFCKKIYQLFKITICIHDLLIQIIYPVTARPVCMIHPAYHLI